MQVEVEATVMSIDSRVSNLTNAEKHIVSEYRTRQLRVSILELFGVTTMIAVLCSLGVVGVAVAVYVGFAGLLCRVLARTWIGWIAGPFLGFLAGLIGLAIHPLIGLFFCAFAVAFAGRQLGRDRFYRETPGWCCETKPDDDGNE